MRVFFLLSLVLVLVVGQTQQPGQAQQQGLTQQNATTLPAPVGQTQTMSGSCTPFSGVKNFNPARFQGIWYEIGKASLIPESTNCTCTTYNMSLIQRPAGIDMSQSEMHPSQQFPSQSSQQLPSQQLPSQQLPSQQLPSQQLPSQQFPSQQQQQFPQQQFPSQQTSQQSQLPSQQIPSQQQQQSLLEKSFMLVAGTCKSAGDPNVLLYRFGDVVPISVQEPGWLNIQFYAPPNISKLASSSQQGVVSQQQIPSSQQQLPSSQQQLPSSQQVPSSQQQIPSSQQQFPSSQQQMPSGTQVMSGMQQQSVNMPNLIIMALNDQEHVMAGDPCKKDFFILSRTRTLPQNTINDLLNMAKQQGFDVDKLGGFKMVDQQHC